MASIHSAAKRGDVDLIEYKLNSDPTLDVNAQDGIGNGILHLSARFGHKELLEMLYVMNSKRFPFNPFLRNKEGKTALELAVEFDHADCSGILSNFPHLGQDKYAHTKTETKTESALCVVDAPEGPSIHDRYAENEFKEEIQRTIVIKEKMKWKADHEAAQEAHEAAMAELKDEVQALTNALSEAHLREAGDDTKLKEEANLRMVVYNEKSALQAEHASLLAKMEQADVELRRLSQIEVALAESRGRAPVLEELKEQKGYLQAEIKRLHEQIDLMHQKASEERKKATDELDVERQKTSDERAKSASMSNYQAMVEEQRQLIAGFHKENAELRATISKLHDKEVVHADALQASHMEASGATAQCKALEYEVRLREERIHKVQETRDREANALSQTIEKMEEQARGSAQGLVEAHGQHAALSKVIAELQGAGAKAEEELEEHKIAAACNATAQDNKIRMGEAALEKALLAAGVELQALQGHTAANIKHQAQETTALEAKNVELQTQLLEKAKLVELREKDLERIRTLVGRTREEAHNKVEDMEKVVSEMKKAHEEERESDRVEAVQTKAERDALFVKAQQESAAEVTEMEVRVKALKQELTEAKNERSAALSALTLEYTLEKAEMEKALMEEHTTSRKLWEKTAKLEGDLDQETHRTTDLTKELSTLKDDLVTLKDDLGAEKAQNLVSETKVQKMEQAVLLLKETETERDWLAQSKAAMVERLAAHKEEKDEWKATRESYQSRYDKQQESIDKYNTQLEEKQTRYFAEVAATSMLKSELLDVKEKYAETKEKLEAADVVKQGLTEQLNETRALMGVVTTRNTELTSVARGMEGEIDTLHTLKAELAAELEAKIAQFKEEVAYAAEAYEKMDTQKVHFAQLETGLEAEKEALQKAMEALEAKVKFTEETMQTAEETMKTECQLAEETMKTKYQLLEETMENRCQLADQEVARMAAIQDGLKIKLQEAMSTLAALESQEMMLQGELKAKAGLSASNTEIYQQERSKLVEQKQQVEAELEQATKQLKYKDDEIAGCQLKNGELEAAMASLEALKCETVQSLQECEEHMQADKEHMQAYKAKIKDLESQMAHAKQTFVQLAAEKEELLAEKAEIIVAKEIEEQTCSQLLATLERYKNEMSRMTAGRAGALSQAQAKLCLPEAPSASGQTSGQATKIPAFLLDC
mmetsp:Transcript_17776/g.29891  ORF Transcript_17776/g.29891 Transcript_17776/m.29891 type:complete len:1177 (-) Transcript_17776:90-3620(-)|eukprot:CAMPEP_0198203138 /NCGR_PEP_ID=MMETSP1445-20131203/6390_1 /TAXON_ID=36898 /ORGANISM="Pyramimonas sp., Strain CCMP2087" /LENGTH=1176 /DNA_ID=CAMNT_0043874395 /DNA_START=191 /DNA_END=3721 /DNA_ORIENTATION=-